jgi:hypothetical protein
MNIWSSLDLTVAEPGGYRFFGDVAKLAALVVLNRLITGETEACWCRGLKD